MTDPYATPQSDVLLPESDAELIRNEHIQHEASIRSVGFLYYMSGFIMLAALVVTIIDISSDSGF